MADDPFESARVRLRELHARLGVAHPEVLQEWRTLAELVGRRGDAREAARMYQALGEELSMSVGRFDGRVLDAYESMSRWVSRS